MSKSLTSKSLLSNSLKSKSLKMRQLWVRWTTWEYLPWWLANVPVYVFFGWFALRARWLFFFSNVNPGIPLGGAMGESKGNILRMLPESLLPKTAYLQRGEGFEQVLEKLRGAQISFPVVAKPDVGERGFLIKKINGPDELRAHLERYPTDFLVQEFLSMPIEMTVLFHRFPDGHQFDITSVCLKEFMAVQGDGASTVRVLMAREVRAAFQLERFEREYPDLLEKVPAEGQTLLLEPIGNHARGTKFLNANFLIDADMVNTFRQICARIEGIYYGRFDLKCASVEAMRRGEFKVMELNGVLGEPAHIYDPAFGMWRAYRDLYRHWRLLFDLHRAQARKGVHPTPFAEGWRYVQNYFRYKKQLETR